jgi:hypothetical protein
MQTITVTAPVPGKDDYFTRTFAVDETIGTKAGRDIYATARGTTKTMLRKINPFAWAWVNLTIEGAPIWYHIYVRDRKFECDERPVI